MTIQWGETGRFVYGVSKSVTISPYVSEQNITPTALPTAQPGTPQCSWTITSSMVPAFSGLTPVGYKSCYGFNVSGQNTSGASATVYYQVNKNGTSIKTGNLSISNNNYYTLSALNGSFVVGDKIDYYVWTTASSGVNIIYQNIYCLPSRLDTGAKNLINFSPVISSLGTSTYFPLTGKVGNYSSYNLMLFPTTNSSNSMGCGVGSYTLPLFSSNGTYKLFQFNNGDAQGLWDFNQSATYYPYVSSSAFVSSISYRELLR